MMNLPKSNEPLVLANGTVVMPHDGSKVQRTVPKVTREREPKQPREVEPHAFVPMEDEDEPAVVPQTQRKLSDLPETARNMNPVCVIVAYSMFGLSVPDIATATNLNEEQVEAIQQSPAFISMRNSLVETVLEAEASSVRELFVKQARNAVHVMVDSLHNGARSTRMSAARDILDRAGHRPADIVDHRHSINGGLVIEVVRKSESENVPTIEMEID